MCYTGPVSEVTVGSPPQSSVVALPIVSGEQMVLTQVVVKVNEEPGSGASATVVGPVFAELWLQRQDKGHNVLLDEGFIMGGPIATIVGIMGRVAYAASDVLLVKTWNDSGTNVGIKISTAYDQVTATLEDPGACRLAKLSTKHEATFVFDLTFLNDAITAGSHVVKITSDRGMRLLYGAIYNGDAGPLGAYCSIKEQGGQGQQPLYVNAALAASGIGQFPTLAVTYGATYDMDPSAYLELTVVTVSLSQDSRYYGSIVIKNTKPTVTMTGPALCTKTVNVSKVIP